MGNRGGERGGEDEGQRGGAARHVRGGGSKKEKACSPRGRTRALSGCGGVLTDGERGVAGARAAGGGTTPPFADARVAKKIEGTTGVPTSRRRGAERARQSAPHREKNTGRKTGCVCVGCACTEKKKNTRPLLFVGFFSIIMGVQFVLTGILSETLARIYFESGAAKQYQTRNPDDPADGDAWTQA